MARTKKGEASKSDAIRTYLSAHKGAKASAVVAALAEQGVQVSTPLIYAIKGKGRSKRGPAKTKRGDSKASPEMGTFSLETLLTAKKLTNALGGVEKAREVLVLLEKLS